MGFPLYTIGQSRPLHPPLTVEPELAGQPLKMEVDTGAALSLLPKSMYEAHFSKFPLTVSDVTLRTYTGEAVVPLGELCVPVTLGKQRDTLSLLVVDTTGPPLLGRNWLDSLQLDWSSMKQVHRLSGEGPLADLLDTHRDLFKEELGTLKGTKASIRVDTEVDPQFCRARQLPYATRAKVDEELDRLLAANIIEPVRFSEWAAPVVPVRKDDGSIRLCGDYKLTVNRAAKLERYPIPLIEDLFAKLSGGKTFSKLDMSHAYQQLVLEEESRQYTTINTHRGLFRYTRLPFGVASAPALFQRTMETLLQGIPHVAVYLDDIIITGLDEAEHRRNLEQVLQRLGEAGLRLKRAKSSFMQEEVVYLGHRVTAEGLYPLPEKVRAIQLMPRPNGVWDLQVFLGMLNYYGLFLPNLSTVLAPLHGLLRHNMEWRWGRSRKGRSPRSRDCYSRTRS